MNSVSFPSPPTDLSDDSKDQQGEYSNSTPSNESGIRRHYRRRRKKRNRRDRSCRFYKSPAPPTGKQDLSNSGLVVLIPANERHQKAVDCRFYHLIHKPERYDDDVSSEIQQMPKKVAVQINNQTCYGKDSNSVINF